MADAQLALQLMADLESDRVERKSAVRNDKEKIAQAICAFANDLPYHRQPGYILIGVDDKAGGAVGLPITDALLIELAGLRDSGLLLPQPVMSVEKITLPDGNDIALITVTPSDMPPVRYKGQVWIRVGPRRALANEQEERILSERRTARALTFDQQSRPDSRLEQLDIPLFQSTYLPNAIDPIVLEENHRSVREQLASLRFYDLEADCPTNAGLIVFGKDVLRWLPGAYLQFVRFDGTDMTSPVLNERQIQGDLQSILREVEAIIAANVNAYPLFVSPLREEMRYSYPSLALREFLLNAIMHRDYYAIAPVRFYWFNDHIEIQSPGGLYGSATPQNFPTQNSYRNPVMAEALKILGYVNRFGMGVIRAQRALQANDQQATFVFDPAYVMVKIPSRESVAPV